MNAGGEGLTCLHAYSILSAIFRYFGQ